MRWIILSAPQVEGVGWGARGGLVHPTPSTRGALVMIHLYDQSRKKNCVNIFSFSFIEQIVIVCFRFNFVAEFREKQSIRAGIKFNISKRINYGKKVFEKVETD
jgi:hypothetical protein